MTDYRPGLIIIGGFAGTGKTLISKRLSSELRLPRLGSDDLGKAIRNQDQFQGSSEEAYVIGYAVLWKLADDCLGSGLPIIVDTNMGWDVSWESAGAVQERNPGSFLLPIVLRCPRQVCLDRIRARFFDEPGEHGDPERFLGPDADRSWNYLSALNRSDVCYVDANRPLEAVFREVRSYALKSLEA